MRQTQTPRLTRIEPGLYRTDTVDHFLTQAHAARWLTCHICGSAINDKEALLRTIYASFRLPAYGGLNWDAMEELLTDPDALPPAPGYLIAVTESYRLAGVLPGQWRTLQALLRAATDYWRAENVPFTTLFQHARRTAPEVPWL